MTPLIIQQENYSGPLNLLLELIQKRKLHITDVSLAEITEEYLERLYDLNSLDYDEVSEFLYIASILILIKSKILVPKAKLAEDEAEDLEALKMRLKLLANIKAVSKKIRSMYMRAPMFGRRPAPLPFMGFRPDDRLTPEFIHSIAQKIIADNEPKPAKPKATIKYKISIGKIIEKIKQHINIGRRINLIDLIKSAQTEDDSRKKDVVIVGFLAILEVSRKNPDIEIAQNDIFGDISLFKK